ncbi:MAG: cation:proton antiporter [Deltaproteobacteria bacterium]|nr:cation:proton antiporter [Deltaproteobacteria bacterium]
MHGFSADLLMLLVLLGGAFLGPILSSRLRMPSAILLIGFGLLVGPHLLGWVKDTTVVAFLSEVGFILLMFLAGLEIDFNGIRRRGRNSLLLMFSICLVIFGLSFGAAFFLGLHPIFGLAMGATSVGLPLAVLKEMNRLRSPLGQQILLLGSVGEFLTVLGMTLFYFGARYGLSWELAFGLGKLVGVLLVAGLTLSIGNALAWWRPHSFSNLVATHESSEIGVRASLLIMVAFSSLAIWAGVEPIVGAFLAGALIAFVFRGKEVLEEKLSVVGHGLFVPIFFVVVGLRFDPAAVTGPNLLLAGQLLLAVFLARLLPSLSLIRQGLSPREMLGAVSLLSAPLTLVVAIAALGVNLGVINSRDNNTLILLAVMAGVIFPVLFRLLASKQGKKT